MYIKKAKHSNDDEQGQSEKSLNRLYLMVSLGEEISLPCLTFKDYPKDSNGQYKEDGCFEGCCNKVCIITEKEKDALIALNASRRELKEKQEREERINNLMGRITKLKSSKLYTDEEAQKLASQYNDANNDGGYGYVPHFSTFSELENAEYELSQLTNFTNTK